MAVMLPGHQLPNPDELIFVVKFLRRGFLRQNGLEDVVCQSCGRFASDKAKVLSTG